MDAGTEIGEWAIDRETVLTSKPVRWLLSDRKAANGVSVLGGVVAMILDKVFGGTHNVPLTKAPVAWEDDYVVHVTLSWQTLATVDDSRLTALVVLAHDNALRLQIAAKAANHIELMFHQRQRAGSLSQRCPTLEEHVERIRGVPADEKAARLEDEDRKWQELARRADELQARNDNLITAGNELLERLQLFMSGSGDECISDGVSCWDYDCHGTIYEDADDPWGMPSVCSDCGETCDCTRCSDRKAIRRWLAAQNDTVPIHELIAKEEEE